MYTFRGMMTAGVKTTAGPDPFQNRRWLMTVKPNSAAIHAVRWPSSAVLPATMMSD